MRTVLLAMLFAATLVAQTPSVIPPPPDVAAPPKDAKKTSSSLATKVLQPGIGKDHPRADETVIVNYTGWTTDGKMFDSSVTRGTPACFPLNRVISGWTEGVQLMVVGEKRRLWVPEPLAYQGKRDPKGMLVFDVELLDMPTRPPADVKAPPADAKRTASMLAYKMLKEGTARVHPKATDMVMVHYTGWTTDGKMFDTSVCKQPLTFPLNGVIAGWTEGVQLMVEGEKTRFWIPEALAYKGQAGAPKGMLVFDVELLRIN